MPPLFSRFLPLLTLMTIASSAKSATPPSTILVEAESFSNPGGWVLDTQFIDLMGSPYLLAHGLGKPVAPAETKINVTEAGSYRVWVRTKDWVGQWKAPGAPGRFHLAINGADLKPDFGTEGADWHWQDGGTAVMPKGEVSLALHDLTGFDGRCDAILFSKDPTFIPPNKEPELRAFRQKLLDVQPRTVEKEYDLVIAGGGYAGTAAALSAARQGLKVALVQDRPVLGGNGSSEVRVWAQGGTMRGKYPHLGEIVEEFADHSPDSPGAVEPFGDELKLALVRHEKNIDLYLNHHVLGAQTSPDKSKITSLTALNTRTSEELVIRGKFFADCTGHAALGASVGAEFRMLEQGHMGMSNMWYYATGTMPKDWPETPWALPLEPGDFPPLKASSGKAGDFMKGEWFWESGFNKHPLEGLESMRDWNLRAVFGAFSALKHGPDKEKYRNAELQWVAFIGGPRESRLLTGDLILSQEDIVAKKEFPDGTVPTTWDLDLHYPKEQFAKKFPEDPFISRAAFGKGVDKRNGYPLPYRCFYSKNISNLFMAGRCISVDHNALGTIRVMRTCGMMGEVVGKAAYLCVKEQTTPRGVYDQHLDKLLDLCRQPGAMRRESLDSTLVLPPGALIIPNVKPPGGETQGIDPKTLTGIIVDDPQAKLTGKWTEGSGVPGFIGQGYLYGGESAVFTFQVPKTGTYDVQVSYTPHEKRGSHVHYEVVASDGTHAVTADQTKKPEVKEIFHSLGKFKFAPDKAGEVHVSGKDGGGTVCVDAVRVIAE